jgi:hypothetical protein
VRTSPSAGCIFEVMGWLAPLVGPGAFVAVAAESVVAAAAEAARVPDEELWLHLLRL